jgi:ATP/maltotriose-dependent transcriptional regulator MalT
MAIVALDVVVYYDRMSNNKHGPSEAIKHNGRTYRRYPQSPRREMRVYFSSAGGRRLHRAIWEERNGPIPGGFHVHHVDGNPLNNDISNLALLEEREHQREHWDDAKREWARQNIRHAQAAAPAWHRSPEGRAWHSEHAREIAANLQPVTATCSMCGAEFQAKYKRAILCSNKCRAKHRRESGLDDREYNCDMCGKPYIRNRFQAGKFCSRSCSARSRGPRL